jgi:hypothetical protein
VDHQYVIVAFAVADKQVAVAGSAEMAGRLAGAADKLIGAAGKLAEAADKLAEVAGKSAEVAGKLVEVVDNPVEVDGSDGSGNLYTSWRVLDFVLGRRHIGGSAAELAYVLDES